MSDALRPHPVFRRTPRPRARLTWRSVGLQVAILAGTAAFITFAAPCSPLTIWGSAYCPAGLGRPEAGLGGLKRGVVQGMQAAVGQPSMDQDAAVR